jgi:hypothetical protein
MIRYSIHKAAADDFMVKFDRLSAAEAAETLALFRRFQRTRDGTVTDITEMTKFLKLVDDDFSYAG